MISVSAPRGMRLTEHVALTENMRDAYEILVENVKGKDHSRGLDINGKKLLILTLKNRI
jgi:hypothetical protein